jgi:hypothetical protein
VVSDGERTEASKKRPVGFEFDRLVARCALCGCLYVGEEASR